MYVSDEHRHLPEEPADPARAQRFFLGVMDRDLNRHLDQCRFCSAGDPCADGHYLTRAAEQLDDLIQQRSQP